MKKKEICQLSIVFVSILLCFMILYILLFRGNIPEKYLIYNAQSNYISELNSTQDINIIKDYDELFVPVMLVGTENKTVEIIVDTGNDIYKDYIDLPCYSMDNIYDLNYFAENCTNILLKIEKINQWDR